MNFFKRLFSFRKKKKENELESDVNQSLDLEEAIEEDKLELKNKKIKLEPEPEPEPKKPTSFFKRLFKKTDKKKLDKSLEKTSKSFLEKLKTVVLGKSTVDAAVLGDLEEILITSDVGVETTLKIIDAIEERVKNEKYTNAQELDLILKEEIQNIIYDEKD